MQFARCARATGQIYPLSMECYDSGLVVELQVRLPDTFDADAQHIVALNTGTAQCRFALLRSVAPVARRRDPHHLAERLDTVGMAVPVDDSTHCFKWRPSSDWAKKALARARVLFALRDISHFSFERLDALTLGSSQTWPLVGITFLLADPAAQRLQRAADLSSDRRDRCPLCRVLAAGLVNHAQGRAR